MRRDLSHPSASEFELTNVLHALSDPVRLRIVAALAVSGEEPSCGSFDLPVTKSTCTHHFKVLREAGVIAMRPVGTQQLSSLRRADLDARFPGLLDAVLGADTGLLRDADQPATSSSVRRPARDGAGTT